MGIIFSILLSAILFLPNIAFPEMERGKNLYDNWCAPCHGYKGKGDGYANDFVNPKPRNFVKGVYKFRSTPTGDPPTDGDISRSIRKGNPGTSMTPWERFGDGEVKDLVDYLKGFAKEVFETPGTPIKIGEPPKVSKKILEEGKKVFEEAKCWECHGREGRGDGEKGWQEKFKDDGGYRIYPIDYTHPWELRNGAGLEDIYRTVTVGIEGTPMTSYQDTLSDEKRWAVTHFIKSLQLKRALGVALRVSRVSTTPLSTDDALWEKLDHLDLPLAGQIIFEPRHFTPMMTNVRVRGVYTDSELAIMLEWSDKKPNKGDDGKPPDAARLQFPSAMPKGAEKPYFYLGDKKNGVNVWQWRASEGGAVELNAKGHTDVREQEKQDLKVVATYKHGLYRVIFKRSLNTADADDIRFEIGKFVPFAVILFDGQNNEEEDKGVISAWHYVVLESPIPLSVYIFPPLVSLAMFGFGITLHRKLAKAHQSD